ncbi:MAG: hypothetical protein AB1467_06010 [Candidatus Diapherotrites archaeon]
MDSFTFLLAVIFLMILIQANQLLIAVGAVLILIFAMRSLSSTVLILAAFGLLYFAKDNIKELAPVILLALIILALLLGSGSKPQQPEYYAPEMEGMGGGYGGLLEGIR